MSITTGNKQNWGWEKREQEVTGALLITKMTEKYINVQDILWGDDVGSDTKPYM